MRITHFAIGAVVVSAVAVIAGCGEGTPEVSKEALTKPMDTSKFESSGMMDQMKANLKVNKSGRPALK